MSTPAPPPADAPHKHVHIYLLAGQNTTATFSTDSVAAALKDARGLREGLLLVACHAAFLKELLSLSPEDRTRCSLDSVQGATDLLDVPSDLRSHPVFVNVNLYLTQLLRFVVVARGSNFAWWSNKSNSNLLLGFSTGQLAASIIAASNDDTLLDHAVEGLRVAFWLGYHAYQFSNVPYNGCNDSPWSVVLLGCSRAEAGEAISAYNHAHPDGPRVYLTAVTNDRCVTVSGRPDAIAEFEANHKSSSTSVSHFAHIHTLYHSPILQSTKERILADLRRREVRFPDYDELNLSLRSSIDGSVIHSHHHRIGSTLVDDILDMLLVHPVNFDKLIDSLQADLSEHGIDSVRLVNLGPGTGLWWSTIRILQDGGLSVDAVDWSSASVREATFVAPSIPPLEVTSSMQQPMSFPEVPSTRQPVIRVVPGQQSEKEPVAIVGMAVDFPGAPDAAEFWKVLLGGINTVGEVPLRRFDVAEYMRDLDGSGRTLQSVYGNFIQDADVFDNAFFRVSPREARSMDPQQRILLRVAYHALEDAGYVPNATPSYDPETFAVHVGAATNDYVHNLRNDIDVYYSTGTLQAFLSGKVSYAFGFGGPSVVVDTACSSAVVAIYQACRSLQVGDCNAALAGGVNVITSPDMHIGLDRAHFLSPSGQCRPWDASADGYCRAEGCGMFVLKRLSDALAENDRILGVIRGIEVNQSGTADSITHPHAVTQAKLYRRVLESANVRPAEVSVVEAHGTGTQAGDPAEIEALRAVFGGDKERTGMLHVTSAKANIGHAEAASGAASLAKLVLMMRHGMIPKVVSLKTLNPSIAPLEQDGLCIDTEASAWNPPPDSGKRIALLNNFGAAGSNAALLLEELPVPPASPGEQGFRTVILGLSCDSLEALEQLRERYLTELNTQLRDHASLVDFAYTATARRQLYRYRTAVSGSSPQELCRELRTSAVAQAGERARKVVFLFSGQGGQYRGMGSGLYQAVPSFREAVDLCHKTLVSWGYQGVTDMIQGVPAPDDDSADADYCLETSHCALFVLEYALASMWRTWGLRPDVVIGHSLGEYAALVHAEVISLDDALRVVAERARLTSQHCPRGTYGMLAVRADPNVIAELLKQDVTYEGLSIACQNSDADCVVGGVLTQVELFQEVCHRSGYPCRRLDVDFAYHTSSMGPILDELRSLGQKIKFSKPKVPLVSTVFGAVIPIGDASLFTQHYFAKHCRDPVLFRHGIQALFNLDGIYREAAWLEIGPHMTTSPLLRGNGLSTNGMVLGTLRKGQADEISLCRALTQLYCAGTETDWRAVFTHLAPSAKMRDLPLYPFMKTSFWVQYVERRSSETTQRSRKPSSTFSGNSMLSQCIHWPAANSDLPALFELDIVQLSPFMDGHQVVGSPLCPASVYHELVLAASHAWCERIGLPPFASSLVLSDIAYEAPLVHSSRHTPSIVRVEISPKHVGGGFNAQFVVRTGPRPGGPWQVHCTGNIRAQLVDSVKAHLWCFRDKIQECIESLHVGARNTRTLYASTIYESFSKVVDYSDAFRTIKFITIRCDGADAYALAQSPAADTGQYVVHPVFMDTLLHAAGFLLNFESDDDGHIFVCSHIQTVTVLPDFLRASAMFAVYCQVGYLSQTMAIADAYAIDLEGSTGQVFAHMGKIQFRRLSKTGFKAILSMSTHDPLDTPSSFVSNSPNTPRQALSVQEHILGLIAHMCDIPVAHVTPDSRLDYLGVDSLMSIELTGRLNEHYSSLSLSPRTLGSFDRIGDLIELIKRHCSTPADVKLDWSLSGTERSDCLIEDDFSCTRYVKNILSAVLDIPTEKLADDEQLDRLGLDSLSSIEVRHTFSSAFHVHVPQGIFVRCKTVGELTLTLKSYLATSNRPHDSSVGLRVGANPMLLQEGGDEMKTPLVLIHDGSGMVHPYMRLGGLGRTVWGVHNPKLPAGDKWRGGIIEIATHYVDLVRATVGAGRPCILGGWSFGGVVAFEVARMLIARGTRVIGLLLIDSPRPQISGELPEAVIDAVVGAKVANPRHAELVRLQMRYASNALRDYDPRQSPASHVALPKAVMLRSQDGYDLDVKDGETAEFLTDRRDPAKSVDGWERLLCATVPVLDIPGNHFQPFEPENVKTVTERARQALQMLEDRPSAIAPESTGGRSSLFSVK
ncbi:ketoacyl-synt-domain-containing protein [Daedalea quercina L-15889]|uniref:Ketoacyl-synt-domain-containing protein n=1 Tax=Daedalea quercina L-15889 TaxID=1314783 RepID=A0A165T6P8_9APHY|nr:ketoacyl-synt-domain-containing protein [Daedalea quercina L-15889]